MHPIAVTMALHGFRFVYQPPSVSGRAACVRVIDPHGVTMWCDERAQWQYGVSLSTLRANRTQFTEVSWNDLPVATTEQERDLQQFLAEYLITL